MHNTCHKGVGRPLNIMGSIPKNREVDLLHSFARQLNLVLASSKVGVSGQMDEENRGSIE